MLLEVEKHSLQHMKINDYLSFLSRNKVLILGLLSSRVKLSIIQPHDISNA